MASSAICRLVLALIEADKFPPKHAAGKKNQNVNGHQYKVDAVKPRSFKVALAVIDRAWSRLLCLRIKKGPVRPRQL